MLKKTINYTDFNDVARSETRYFNLSKSELIDMQSSELGGLSERLQRIQENKNVPEVMKVFKDMILNSYGEKSQDGSRFIKTPEIKEAFYQSAAYDALYIELLSNADAMQEFFLGIIPSDISLEAKKNLANIDKVTSLAD